MVRTIREEPGSGLRASGTYPAADESDVVLRDGMAMHLRPIRGDDGTNLLALYDRIRASSGGVGAAALQHGRCEGCRLSLSPVALNAIRAAAPDAVLRCEECSRILVRVPDSGL